MCLMLRGFSRFECRTILKMQRRVLVYLQRDSDGDKLPRKARFTQVSHLRCSNAVLSHLFDPAGRTRQS